MALSIFSVSILKERLFFNIMDTKTKKKKEGNEYWLHTDDIYDILYVPFAYDFGPPSIAQMYRFCRAMDKLLANENNRIHFYSLSSNPRNSSNAVVLMASYCILKLGWSALRTEELFSALCSFLECYRDASEGTATYRLPPDVCFHALEKGSKLGWINLDTFNYEEYTFYEQVENGDFNWIVPDKFIAMCSPTTVAKRSDVAITHTPDYYIPYFKRNNVTAIVRLNNAEYDRQSFISEGIKHFDMYFIDGTAPPVTIVEHFLYMAEQTSGVIAVHCKQGLGRTGTLIACYIMKHYQFSAAEAIAFIRIQRPGSVVGPQQAFLTRIQPLLVKAEPKKEENKMGSPKCSDSVITPLKKQKGTPIKICA
jgi:cell division cycle 14